MQNTPLIKKKYNNDQEDEDIIKPTKLDKLDNIPIISSSAPVNELNILDIILKQESQNTTPLPTINMSKYMILAIYITILFILFRFEPITDIFSAILHKYFSFGIQIIFYVFAFYLSVLLILKKNID